jgi:hypothetical protein
MDRQKLLVAGLVCCSLAACNTAKMSNTARTGREQLLVSSSIDRALDKVDFSNFRGQNVFVDDKQLDSVDKGYLLGSVRHRMLNADATLVDAKDKADVVIEVRSGGVGTDSSDMFVGMPGLAVPGPLPIALPEVRLVSRTSQTGVAKIGLAAYEAKTGRPLGVGGMAEAQSNDLNWYVFGVGPWESGTLKQEIKEANQSTGDFTTVPSQVAFAEPSAPGRISGLVQPASQESDAGKKPPAEAE